MCACNEDESNNNNHTANAGTGVTLIERIETKVNAIASKRSLNERAHDGQQMNVIIIMVFLWS